MSQHNEWMGFAASYALGALDADDTAGFERHLASCPECQAEVREHGEVAAALARGVEQKAPPPALRQRILDQAAAVRPIATSQPEQDAGDRPAPRSNRGWQAMAAGFTLAALGITGWALERNRRIDVESSLSDVSGMLDVRTAELARTDALLARRDSLLAVILSEDVRTITLTSQGAPPAARMYWNATRGTVVLTAFDLPPAAPGRTYQLWGISAGQQPVSLGTFDTDATGNATVELNVDPLVRIEVGAVTDEPAGGSPQPTTTPFLVGTLAQ